MERPFPAAGRDAGFLLTTRPRRGTIARESVGEEVSGAGGESGPDGEPGLEDGGVPAAQP